MELMVSPFQSAGKRPNIEPNYLLAFLHSWVLKCKKMFPNFLFFAACILVHLFPSSSNQMLPLSTQLSWSRMLFQTFTSNSLVVTKSTLLPFTKLNISKIWWKFAHGGILWYMSLPQNLPCSLVLVGTRIKSQLWEDKRLMTAATFVTSEESTAKRAFRVDSVVILVVEFCSLWNMLGVRTCIR